MRKEISKSKLTEEDIRFVTKLFADKFVSYAESLDNLDHMFSNSFNEKMSKIMKKSSLFLRKQHKFRLVVVSFLTIILFVGAITLSNETARAGTVKWFRVVKETLITYQNVSDSKKSNLPHLKLGWIPDGFKLVEKIRTETFETYYFENFSGEKISFDYYIDANVTDVHYYTDVDNLEQVIINGIVADYYAPSGKSEQGNLIWKDSEKNIVLLIDACLSKRDIILIAENIVEES